MDRSAGRRRWAAARAGLLAVLGAGLLAACGLGGEAPTATPVAPSPTVAPTATIPLPTPTSAAAPTAPRNGNPTGATGWQVAGLTGEVLYALGGTGALNAPVYAGGTGLWSTTDQGATWEDRGLAKGTRIAEIEVSVSNPKVIYAGTGAGCAGGQPSGQFRSTDGGATWQPLPQAPASIQIDGKNPDHLIAMTCRGVVRSADGGQTWTALTDRGAAALVNHNGTLVRVAPSDPAVIYATYVAEGGSTRIRTSTDSGTTWTDSGAEYPGLSDILVDAAHPQHAWAAIPGCGTSCYGILRTTDAGKSWQSSVTGLDAAHDTSFGSHGAYQLSTLAAQYSSAGPVLELYVGTFPSASRSGAGIFGSRDGGLVWVRFGGDLSGRALHNLLVTRESSPGGGPARVELYGATDNGVHKLYLNPAP